LTGGHKRPLGIILGFILSFTFFTLFLTTLVKLLGIPVDTLRNLAVLILFGFGLSLMIPQIQAVSERLFSKLGQFAPQTRGQGFGGGLVIGAGLGLIWTPCVGPILASIITLAATSRVTLEAVLITLAYATGTAIPLLLITFSGRQLLTRQPWLVKNSSRLQKIFGLVMLLTALAIYFNVDRTFQTWILQKFPSYGTGLTSLENNAQIQPELAKLKQKSPMFNFLKSDLGAAPDFAGGGKWFNSQPLTITQLRGKVVLVDFWTYTCINCIRTLPYLKSWYEKYQDKGLVIVGVHTPEFEFEKKAENVSRAITDFGLTYPVVQDNDYQIWNAYANHYWPAKYLVDKNGQIRYSHFGEGEYDQTEEMIQQLLKETGADLTQMPITNPEYRIQARTPETYLGYLRVANLASSEAIQQDLPAAYSIPEGLPTNNFAFGGVWTIGGEYASPMPQSTLEFNFEAQNVFLVMRPRTGSGQVKVFLDNQIVTTQAGEDVKNGVVTVDTDRLYKLIKLNSPGKHLLRLEFVDGNLEIYAFTFG